MNDQRQHCDGVRSTQANTWTEILALGGLSDVFKGLPQAFKDNLAGWRKVYEEKDRIAKAQLRCAEEMQTLKVQVQRLTGQRDGLLSKMEALERQHEEREAEQRRAAEKMEGTRQDVEFLARAMEQLGVDQDKKRKELEEAEAERDELRRQIGGAGSRGEGEGGGGARREHEHGLREYAAVAGRRQPC